MKKEELITKLAKAELEIEQLKLNDLKLRTEFSKVLDAPTKKKPYYSEYEQLTYSWHEIFFEIGRNQNNVINELRDEVRNTRNFTNELSAEINELRNVTSHS